MRAREFIVEFPPQQEKDEQTIIQKIPKQFNGGEIVTWMKFDLTGEVESYSYTYINPKVTKTQEVLSYEVDQYENVTMFHHNKYPDGIKYERMSDMEIRNEFASLFTQYMRSEIKEEVTTTDKTIDDTMKEFKKVSDFIIASRERRRLKSHN